MKGRLSIKRTLTLWFTAFMALTAGLCLGLILITSGQVARKETAERLDLAVRESIPLVNFSNGSLLLDPDFRFYQNNVYLILYNQSGAMLTGETPPGFPVDAPLKNGVTREVGENGESFYVFDLWIPSGWEDGVWIRGAAQSTSVSQMLGGILTMFFLIMPFIILFAAAGGYLIARRALRPIDQITRAAESISEGRDLSRRLSLKPGRDEVGRLASAFDQMFERLEQAFEAEKQFTSDASHELRTPMSVIMAQCEYTLEKPRSAEEYQEALEVIHRQGSRMSGMIRDMLDFTRLEGKAENFAREIVDISELAGSVCEDMALIQEKGIRLNANIKEGVFVEGNRSLLSRLLVNLITNAYRYGKEGGWIRVILKKTETGILLSVEDNGIGMAEEELPKIWNRFYRADPSRSSARGGLGLGLSMVRQIVEIHGGRIRVESREGEGSKFIVFFKN